MSLQNKVIDLLRLTNSSDIELMSAPNCFAIHSKNNTSGVLWSKLDINIQRVQTNIVYWWTLPNGVLGRNELSFRNDMLVEYTNPFKYDEDTQIFSIIDSIGIKIQ